VKGHWRKAVLVYPKFDTADTFWSYESSLKMYSPSNEFGLPKRLLPPLGLLGLYRYLKPYYDAVVLIDRNVDPRALAEQLHGGDHVYLGGMAAQEKGLLADATLAKKQGCVVIVGGTAISKQSPLKGIADHLIENEAEAVIGELLAGLKDGRAKAYYQGSPVEPENFFKPDYSALNLDNYVHMAMQISRGCPEKCEFCDIPARFGKSFRVTPVQDTEASFKQLAELGWTGPVFIVDDNFIGNPRRALETLKNLYAMGELIGVHLPKYTELTLRIADQTPIMAELRSWFRKTNFTTSFYGVETPNKAALEETDKQQNLRGDLTIVQKLRLISEQTGSGVLMGMIFGFDSDSDETVDEFIAFINETHVPIVMVGLLNALPETKLMARLLKDGRLIQSSSCNNSDGVINFIPMTFSIQQAETNYLRILRGIYEPEAYFQRVMAHLQLFTSDYVHKGRSRLENAVTVVKILTGLHRSVFWRYLPVAHQIARKRQASDSASYARLIAEFFSLCAQYSHFSIQTENLATQLEQRCYEPWQQFSWQEMLCLPIIAVVLEKQDSQSELSSQITVQLASGYKVSGTRVDVLRVFSMFYLESIVIDNKIEPSLTLPEAIDLEIKAVMQVADHRSEIVGDSDLSAVTIHVREVWAKKPAYLQQLRRIIKGIQEKAGEFTDQ
jgi:radical SAM superfamily enzyme YgiQ (UPF0313 family)